MLILLVNKQENEEEPRNDLEVARKLNQFIKRNIIL